MSGARARLSGLLKETHSMQRWHEEKAQNDKGLSDWGRGWCEGIAEGYKRMRLRLGFQYRWVREEEGERDA